MSGRCPRSSSDVARSLVTIDLGALRHNARVLADRVAPAALWAVVKADGYGHGAADAGRAALSGGAQSPRMIGRTCQNCHSQVHGSNHPSGARFQR